MTDQRPAAQQAYTLSHFNFLQQKPKLKNTCDLPAEASRAADVSGPDSILASQSMTSKPRAAESQSVLVRLPDAPALPVRKTSTPLPPANFARSEMCLQSGKLVDHKVPSHQQQPLLPLRPSPSTSAGWKRVIRPGPAATKKDDPPLLSRLAKLTNASTLSVASGSHVAGVLPAHVPQERHSHGSAVPPAAQPQQNHDPAASTARHDLLSQQQASALGFSSQSPTAEGSLQSTPSSVPADKPKSILRSRLRLQRPQPEATLTPVTTLPPGTIISSHHADAVPGATQQLQESEPLAKPAAKPTDPMPWCSFGPQPDVQEAAASSCVQTGSSIKQALGKVQDQTAAAQRRHPGLLDEGHWASSSELATPEAQCKMRLKPASAPEGAGRSIPQSGARAKQRSAPRQMKRLYSGLSQEDGPEQHMTPEQIQAQQRRVQEEEEDSELLVDFTGSRGKHRRQADPKPNPQQGLHGSATSMRQSSNSTWQSASQRMQSGRHAVYHSKAQLPSEAMRFDIDDAQQPSHAMLFDIEHEAPDTAMIDIADSPRQQQKAQTVPVTARAQASEGYQGRHAHWPPASGSRFDISDDDGNRSEPASATNQQLGSIPAAAHQETAGHVPKFDINSGDADIKCAASHAGSEVAEFKSAQRCQRSVPAPHPQAARDPASMPAAAPGPMFDIAGDGDDDAAAAAAAPDTSEHQHAADAALYHSARVPSSMPAGLMFDIEDEKDDGHPCEQGDNTFPSATAVHPQHAQGPSFVPSTAPRPMFDIDDADDDDFQPSLSAGLLHARLASHHQASTSVAAPATAPLAAHAVRAVSHPSACLSQHQAGFKTPSAAPPQQQQQKKKSSNSFKPPRRVSPPPAATATVSKSGREAGREAGREGAAADMGSGRPLKRLRKAGQAATPAVIGAAAQAKDGDAEAEDRSLQHALWLSSQEPQTSSLMANASGCTVRNHRLPYTHADHDFEEEEAERTAPLPRASSWKAASRLLSQSETKREEEAEAGRRSAGDAWPKAAASSWNTAHDLLLQKQMTKQRDEEDDEDQEDAPSKPAASGWNTARDLLLQHQQTEAEDRPGQGRDANPFARSKPKGKQTLTQMPRSIQSSSRKSGVSAEALKSVLQQPNTCADLWKKRFYKDSGQLPSPNRTELPTSSSAAAVQPAKHLQHSTAPGVFVSAATLNVDSGSSQLRTTHPRHDSLGPSQRSATQPSRGHHRANRQVAEGEVQAEGREVIDLVESPGNVDARSRTRGLEASSGQEEVSDGPPWWERFPDFVPLSALKWGTNPRDGATVHINYKAQFSGQPIATGRKKAPARNGWDEADDLEVLDVDDEEEQRGAQRSRTGRGRKHGSSGQQARGDGEGQSEVQQGRWMKQNNHNVYIDANGRTLTGSRAYAKAQQDKGSSGNPTVPKRSSRKSPGKGKRKRKSRAKGSKLPSFRATKSRFG